MWAAVPVLTLTAGGFHSHSHARLRRYGPSMQASEQSAPHVAVVGAGWGGWGAAKALLENGCRVTLLDSLPDPCGETPYLTPSGKPFEAGTRGFWKDYPNIEQLVRSLGLSESQVSAFAQRKNAPLVRSAPAHIGAVRHAPLYSAELQEGAI